jgi:hypothetical protein
MAGATVGSIRIGVSIATDQFGKDLKTTAVQTTTWAASAKESFGRAAMNAKVGMFAASQAANNFGGALAGNRGAMSGFTRGMTQARVSLSLFKDSALSAGAGVAKGLVAGVGAGAGQVKKLASAVGPAVMQLGAMGLGAVGVGAAIVGHALKGIDDLSESASRIGVTTAALGSLRYAAQLTGTDAENLDGALLKMNNALSDSVSKGGPAGETLKKMGLDASQLIQMSPDEAFKKISDGFAKLPNDADKASAAMELFGKSGPAMLNTLNAGSKEIDRLSAEAGKLGLAISDVDVSKVGAANDALDKMGYAASGVANAFAIAIAPAVTAVGDQVVGFASQGVGAADVVKAGLYAVATVVGGVADAWQVWKIVAAGVFTVVGMAVTIVLKVILGLGKAIESLINLVPGVKVSFTKGLEGVADIADKTTVELGKKFGTLTKEPWAHEATDKFFNKIESGSAMATSAVNNTAKAVRGIGDSFSDSSKKIKEMTDALKLQIATYGKSAADVEVYKLQQAGASSAVIAGAQAMATQYNALEKQHKAMDEWKSESKKIFEDVMTPLEKYNKQIDKLKNLQANGLIDQTTVDRGTKDAKKDYDKDTTSSKAHSAALERGSVEERSVVLAYRAGGQSNDPIKAVAKSTADGAASQKQAVDTLNKIADYLSPSRIIALL